MGIRIGERLRGLERATRPEDPDLAEALARRWEELPARVRTPSQVLGRRLTGCEGTHGVFPRCDLACTPCYHSREANRVRVDGAHTVREVDAQMRLLRELRGPGQHAQLIGGEVTLLGPGDHAAALRAMLEHGRKPMSMTHGDFDYSGARSARSRAAQERLEACMYAMAHPEDGRLVPACIQHSVLDPRENLRLAEQLPLGDPAA